MSPEIAVKCPNKPGSFCPRECPLTAVAIKIVSVRLPEIKVGSEPTVVVQKIGASLEEERKKAIENCALLASERRSLPN